ncbi:peptidyl-tRNA hydrolase ICT1, mitochondrial isoform X1 [Gadus macrocephalus]|uniref:peptidyl-tRNA hydrolase ICT1, mitochondrial isoform X1 n=1 Tax=Gadus macrocephalus TaxID=80720 RepID=UPI0028CB3EC4|nr:peptidyl-tRNA hydrolase ICT1, mitochondrial isoform X1 [Gadus macrocephalus]
MATSFAQRYLLSRSFIYHLISQHARFKSVKTSSFLKQVIYSSLGYTLRRDNSQVARVHIPIDRLKVSYCRSGGAGGQHVNKVNTKAEIRFHVQTADWIPLDVRQKIIELKSKNRINKAGELLVTSELSRTQRRNLEDCIDKIAAIIAEASEKPREPTPEDIALRAVRLKKMNKERLQQKKLHSTIKQSRRVDFD